MSSELELYTRLNTELVSLVEHFTNLVKATKEGLDADEGSGRPESGGAGAKELRVPGELLEALVEKLLEAGNKCVVTVSALKKGAMVSDFDTLVGNVQHIGNVLQHDTYCTHRGLEHIRRDAESLLGELEAHYYASAHKGALPPAPGGPQGSSRLAELCSQALQMTGGGGGGSGSGGAG